MMSDEEKEVTRASIQTIKREFIKTGLSWRFYQFAVPGVIAAWLILDQVDWMPMAVRYVVIAICSALSGFYFMRNEPENTP